MNNICPNNVHSGNSQTIQKDEYAKNTIIPRPQFGTISLSGKAAEYYEWKKGYSIFTDIFMKLTTLCDDEINLQHEIFSGQSIQSAEIKPLTSTCFFSQPLTAVINYSFNSVFISGN